MLHRRLLDDDAFGKCLDDDDDNDEEDDDDDNLATTIGFRDGWDLFIDCIKFASWVQGTARSS